jgi:succinoglycan biosynthesis protein ExoA
MGDRQDGRVAFVSIIMAVRNEGHTIEQSLATVLAQDYPPNLLEVLVADGQSGDATREKILKIAERDPRVRLIENQGRFVSSGLNAAIRRARGDIVIRMDAHTEYSRDYVTQCVRTLEQTGADNVGGPWRVKGDTYFQKAVAIAFESAFVSGGAGSHGADFEGEVDSVYLGCWRKQTLERLGGFDEEFIRNQDDELNFRIVRSGGKVWQNLAIRSWYRPRDTWVALFRQYAQYGYWKVRVIQKHRYPASLRHVVPGTFMALILAMLLVAPFSSFDRQGLEDVAGVYLVATMVASALCCRSLGHIQYLPMLPAVFWAFHIGYGYGFVRGIVDFLLLRRGARQTFVSLTRR